MASLRKQLRAARSELRAGHWDRARNLYLEIVEASPGHPEATHGAGLAMLRAGDVDAAIRWFRRALEANPGTPELLHGLGRAWLKAGQPEPALRSLQAAHAQRPRDERIEADLARARQRRGQQQPQRAPTVDPLESGSRLLASGRIEEAIDELRATADRLPDNGQVLALLGQALLQDGRLKEAERSLRRALRVAANPSTFALLSDVLSAQGWRVEAEQAIREAIRQSPKQGHAWLRLAHMKRFTTDADEDLQRLLALVACDDVAPIHEEPLRFALGKALDDLGRPDDAFVQLRRANELHKRRHPFDMNAMLSLVDRIEEVCDEAFCAKRQGWGSVSAVPVFIVGVPRCGSTLVEQIIASHPRAYGVGELRKLTRLTADLPSRIGTPAPFPACLPELSKEGATDLAKAYLGRLTRDAPSDVLRVCDKMLSNILLIGLLSVTFPRATILHCRRNLMDAGLSMYMQSFGGSGVGYAYDLDDIGRYYERCERLMDHWKRVSPMTIVEVEYERLVSEPEGGVGRLLEAVGLAWDERCLQPHRAERHVRTVSDWQVRQPIHAKSVERWRAYDRHLAALRKYLPASA